MIHLILNRKHKKLYVQTNIAHHNLCVKSQHKEPLLSLDFFLNGSSTTNNLLQTLIRYLYKFLF